MKVGSHQKDVIRQTYNRDGFVVFSRAFHHQIEDVDKALMELTTGKNCRFKSDVLALASKGVEPDFTSGAKIPWVQYEAGTEDPGRILRPRR